MKSVEAKNRLTLLSNVNKDVNIISSFLLNRDVLSRATEASIAKFTFRVNGAYAAGSYVHRAFVDYSFFYAQTIFSSMTVQMETMK